MRYKINLIEYFEDSYNKHPENIAVVDKERRITFRELRNAAINFAKRIEEEIGYNTCKIIGVLLPKGIEAIVADLAIMYSGNAYMNLDLKNPKDRLEKIVEHCNVGLLISVKEQINLLGSVKNLQINEWDPNDHQLSDSQIDMENLGYKKLIDTDPLCVINTSGSTGIPKAVMLSHRGMIDFLEEVLFEKLLDGPEVIGSLSPIFFDIYSFELTQLMALGSKIVVLPEGLSAFPLKLLEFMKAENVSYIFWVPTIMVNIANLDLLKIIELNALKRIWFAGEVFPTSKFNYWRRNLKDAEFINLYGPIEITVDCLFYNCKEEIPDDQTIPVGRAFRNTGIVLIKDDGTAVVDSNEEAELCIRGSSLAHGYFNDPEKTKNAFVQNPLNHGYPELLPYLIS